MTDLQFILGLVTVILSVIGTILTLRSQDRRELSRLKIDIERDLWEHSKEKIAEMEADINKLKGKNEMLEERLRVQSASFTASIQQLTHERDEAYNGIRLLIAQVLAFGQIPVWEPPKKNE